MKMENQTESEIVLKMAAANDSRQELTASVKRMLWRANNMNPLPRMKAFRLAHEFQHLCARTGEDAATRAARFSQITHWHSGKKVVCYLCGAALKPGQKECGACGCKYKAFREL